jgi:hypothetical protein
MYYRNGMFRIKVIYVTEFILKSLFCIMETMLQASCAYIWLDDAVHVTGSISSILILSWHQWLLVLPILVYVVIL